MFLIRNCGAEIGILGCFYVILTSSTGPIRIILDLFSSRISIKKFK